MTPRQFKSELDGGRTNFGGETIEGSLILFSEIIVEGELDLSKVIVKGNVFLRATIRGNLNFRGIIVEGELDLSEVVVKGCLSFLQAIVRGNLNLTKATIESNLDFRQAAVGGLYLGESTVKGEVFCGEDVARGLQCLLYFGGRVHVDYCAISQFFEALRVSAPQAA